MLNEIKNIKHLIEYLQDRIDEIEDSEKAGYEQALKFIDDYLVDIKDELELEYAEKYVPEYYNF